MEWSSECAVAAAWIGGVGLVCQLAWPAFRTRRRILSVQFGAASAFGLQYALLGAWSGAAVCSLGAAQTLIVLASGRRAAPRRLAIVFLPLVLAVSLATWSGQESGLALAACTLTMLARLQPTTLRLRSLQLCAAPFGAAYDLSVGALPALCGATASAMIASYFLMREVRAASARAA